MSLTSQSGWRWECCAGAYCLSTDAARLLWDLCAALSIRLKAFLVVSLDFASAKLRILRLLFSGFQHIVFSATQWFQAAVYKYYCSSKIMIGHVFFYPQQTTENNVWKLAIIILKSATDWSKKYTRDCRVQILIMLIHCVQWCMCSGPWVHSSP